MTADDAVEFMSRELSKIIKPPSYKYFLRKLEEFGFKQHPLNPNAFFHDELRRDDPLSLLKIVKKPPTVVPRTTQSARTIASRAIKRVLDTTAHSEELTPQLREQMAKTISMLQQYANESQNSLSLIQIEINNVQKRCQLLRQFIYNFSSKFLFIYFLTFYNSLSSNISFILSL